MSRDQMYEKDWIEFYDKWIPEGTYKISFPTLLKVIREYKPDAKDVLELGCGTGRYTKYFAKAGFNVKGTDISAAAIEKAKKRVGKARFEVADMAKFNEPPNYDVVACLFEVFRYNKSYAHCEKTLKNAFKALRPGGIFMCDFGIVSSTKEKIKSPDPHNVKIGNKIYIIETTRYSKGNFDVREDHYKLYRKKLLRKPVLIGEGELDRSPLIKIPDSKMQSMLKSAGLNPVEIIKGFHHWSPDSRLFVAQKPDIKA